MIQSLDIKDVIYKQSSIFSRRCSPGKYYQNGTFKLGDTSQKITLHFLDMFNDPWFCWFAPALCPLLAFHV